MSRVIKIVLILVILFFIFTKFFSNPCRNLPKYLTQDEYEARCFEIQEIRNEMYWDNIDY